MQTRSLILVSALLFGVQEVSRSAEPSDSVDYGAILERIGISDEPSILNLCDEGYSSIRVIGLAGGHPFAIFRVETGPKGRLLVKRLIENGIAKSTQAYSVSDDSWATIVDRLQDSGFWTYEEPEGIWMPHGHQQWIEACVDTKFHSISIYPDKDGRMSELTDLLVLLTQ